jgi:tritrans,polycis-undecaprenyl-diphosphate synthase [geranylgeranyl-diphosphate specific]
MLERNKTPKHIGVILDGNRRFAKRLMLKPWMGHEWGAKKIGKLMKWCLELGVKEVSLYVFSVDNFNRPKEEFDYILNVFRKSCKELKDKIEKDSKFKDEAEKAKVKIRFLGRLNMFPKDIQDMMKEIMEKSAKNDNLVVNFCMAYGGRQEIVDAARKIAKDLEKGKISQKDIDEESFKKYLYMSDDPDLIIRTGGEKRLSGFLLYQSSYTELVFLEKFWPEFEKKDLVKAINDYKQRDRRFGR